MAPSDSITRRKYFEPLEPRPPQPPFAPLWQSDGATARDAVKATSDAADRTDDHLYRHGYAAGFAAAAGVAAMRAQSDHERRLAEYERERSAWQADEGARLERMVQEELIQLEVRLRNEIATLAESWIVKALEQAAIAEFVGQAERIAQKPRNLAIEVTGQGNLAQRAADQMSELGLTARARADTGGEMSTKIGFTMLETRIQEIMKGLR